jgi:hypothetical protein
MAFRFFDTAKVPVTCDKVDHSTEKRKDGETKVVVLTCRVQPFDHKLATSMHDDVRRTLFKLNHPDPYPHLARVNFALGVPRQHIDCYATPETKDSGRRLEFVKVSTVYVRTEKGTTGYAGVFKLTFGPCDDKELGFVEAWRNGMKFLTFHESEPNAEYEEVVANGDGDEDEDDDQLELAEGDAAESAKPADAVDREASAKRERANRSLHTHRRGGSGKARR